MNVSNYLGFNESFELLDKLRNTVRSFASREDQLKAESQGQEAGQARSFESETARLSARLSERLTAAETAWQSERAAAQARYVHCQDRVRQALKASQKSVLERIEQEEGRRKYQLQRSTLETERRRESGLAGASDGLKEFQRQLADSQQSFEVLAKEADQAFRGYGRFQSWLSASHPWPEPETSGDENELLAGLQELQARVSSQLGRFRGLFLARFFRRISLWLLVILLLMVHAALIVSPRYFNIPSPSETTLGASFLTLLLATLAAYFYGRRQASPQAAQIASDLAKARRLQAMAGEKAKKRHEQEELRLEEEFRAAKHELNQQWREAVRRAEEGRELRPRQLREKEQRISAKIERRYREELGQLDQSHSETTARLRQETEARQRDLAAARQDQKRQLEIQGRAQWQNLVEEWNRVIHPFQEAIEKANAAARELFPEWQAPAWNHWTPPLEFKNAAKIGRLEVETDQWIEGTREDRRLVFQPSRFSLPLLLTYPRQGSLLIETARTGGEAVAPALNHLIFRLLAATPSGKINLTLIDPVGLGQNFAGLTHLADYGESVINGRIWTQAGQIEEKLAELNEHMEKVIQMYLRNEYPTIAEYNAQAGVMAEKYHFLVIAGFPVNFSETAARRLSNIVSNGARCGVYTLIHWDQRHALPHDFLPDELRKHCARLVAVEDGFTARDQPIPGTRVLLDSPPAPDFATRFLRQVGRSSLEAARVEVPFTDITPSETEVWSLDTTEQVRVPIGRSGATKRQYLALGQGTRQHALIVGKTGSGKSTLFHIIITNLALWCDPEQIEFYLVDFKKGVEFKRYATHRLPQARVVAIESDREFGLSVLQRVDEELRRRGDLFRKMGAQDLAGYKRAGGTGTMPRCLLIIDEFQEFFVEEDRISQSAALLLDRIVRQGRAFGIHVLLGSQTLGGAYTLARTTLGQMVVRIALQCNEADAALIMDENNTAPRLLSRPGEGIYNDASGALEGNSPFQAAWLSDEMRDASLARIRRQSERGVKTYPGPMVFEGNTPAEVRENQNLRKALETDPAQAPLLPRLWLGAPNSIKGPTEAALSRQSGSHLLLVGQREESILALMSIFLVSLAAQFPPKGMRLILFDSTVPGSPPHEYLDAVAQAIPQAIQRPKHGELTGVLEELVHELEARREREKGANPAATFLFIQGLQHFRKLKQEDDYSLSPSEAGPQAGALLAALVDEGPGQGLHLIASCDTYSNVLRFLGRKTLSEIALRLLFQMSANDSASLIDSPEAASLGLHRALFYNDQEGYQEIFRPYALPGHSWLEEVCGLLRNRAAGAKPLPNQPTAPPQP